MPELIIDPPVASDDSPTPFIQSISLFDDDTLIARAKWQSSHDVREGVVEILALTVFPPHQRLGHAKTLLQAVIRNASDYHRAHDAHLRRAWTCIAQKSQVIGRSFLTGAGFHHVGTIPTLFRDEDGLIYTRSFD